MNKIRFFTLLLALGFPFLGFATAITFDKGELTIQTEEKPVHLSIEVAKTEQQKELGLMNRTMLPDDFGMLFLWDKDKNIAMWMKNTPHALDMLFIDSHGTIQAIIANAQPNSTDIIKVKMPSRAVLELPGGTAQQKHIKVGDHLIYPAFQP